MQNTTTNQDFTFFIDQKIEMWTRSTKHIQAQSLQEAEQIVREQMDKGELYENVDEYEFLYDTHKDLDIIEVLNPNGDIINQFKS